MVKPEAVGDAEACQHLADQSHAQRRLEHVRQGRQAGPDRHRSRLVYLATTGEYQSWFTIKHTASEAGVAVTLGPGDIEVLIRMPEADQTRLVGSGGVAAVIGHEFGHVATLQEKSTKPTPLRRCSPAATTTWSRGSPNTAHTPVIRH